MTSKALSGAAFLTFSTLVLTTHPRYEETQNGWCCFLHNDNSVQSRLVLKLKLLQDLNPQCMLNKKVRELKQLYCLLSRKTKKSLSLETQRGGATAVGACLWPWIFCSKMPCGEKQPFRNLAHSQNAAWKPASPCGPGLVLAENLHKKTKQNKKQAQMLAASIKTQEFREPPVDLYRACGAIRVKASRKLITSVAGCPGKWKKKKRASVRNVGTLPFQTKGSPHLRFAQT